MDKTLRNVLLGAEVLVTGASALRLYRERSVLAAVRFAGNALILGATIKGD